jgi:DNA-binding GntR family transcriptional regulator
MSQKEPTQTVVAAKKARKAPAKKRGGWGEIVYRELRRDIIAMTLSPGTFLDETALSKRFGRSRSPIREALVRLSAEGLVITEQNRCSIVAHLNLPHLPKLLEALCLMQRMNSRLAAKYRTAEELDNLWAIHERHLQAINGSTYC